MRTTRILGISAAAAALVAGGQATQAGATPLSCGQTVNTSVTLTADIGPCHGNGLVVTAGNITVDLSGHTIRGDGNPLGTPDQTGIKVLSAPGVRILNGTVRDFSRGVDVFDSPGALLRLVTLTANVGRSVDTPGGGVWILGSDSTQVLSSTITANGPAFGVNVEGTQHAVISDSLIADNNIVSPAIGENPASQFDIGVAFGDRVSDTTIQRNRLLGNGYAAVGPGADVTSRKITGNIIRDNGVWGLNTGGRGGDVVEGNIIDHNGFDQFRVPGTSPDFGTGGIIMCGSCLAPGPADTFRANQITNNRGAGISIQFNYFACCDGFVRGYVRPHQILSNTVRNNTGDGIYIECDQTFVPWPFQAGVSHVECLNAPPHPGPTISGNSTGGNGGAGAGTTAWDLHDGNPNCNGQTWVNNTFQTATPACAKG